jgi:formate dehydrogenase
MGLFGEPPALLRELAAKALDADGAGQFLAAAQELAASDPRLAKERTLFWSYRALAPHLPAPSLAALWLQCHLNAMLRSDSVLRALGGWSDKSPFEVGTELYRRVLDHPEGVEIARLDPERSFDDNVGFEDGRVRLAPESMIAEIGRAAATPPATDPDYPFVLAAGLRTRWTANTIHRDPKWRKGRGPHCALNLSAADAKRLGVEEGQWLRVSTRRGSVTLPAQIDGKLLPGHVWMPNGFGMATAGKGNGEAAIDGANQNELTDVADRDPFTGIPHHRYVLCRLEPVAQA